MPRSVLFKHIDEIKKRLDDGEPMASIAKSFGVTREAVRLFTNKNIPFEQRKRKCLHCGKLLDGSVAYKTWFHPECRVEHARKSGVARQRTSLGIKEAKAFEEYKKRGFNVLWMPFCCPFDFVVNGKRVVVFNSNLFYGRRFVWQFERTTGADPNNVHSNVCDVYHLIGTDGPDIYHYLIPAHKLDGKSMLCITPEKYSTRPWLLRSYLLDEGWGVFE